MQIYEKTRTKNDPKTNQKRAETGPKPNRVRTENEPIANQKTNQKGTKNKQKTI